MGRGSNKVEISLNEVRKKGHGAAPVLSKKKEVCPAYDKTCNTFVAVGHFAKTKACRKRFVKMERIDTERVVG